jgi:hypothetical protein
MSELSNVAKKPYLEISRDYPFKKFAFLALFKFPQLVDCLF